MIFVSKTGKECIKLLLVLLYQNYPLINKSFLCIIISTLSELPILQECASAVRFRRSTTLRSRSSRVNNRRMSSSWFLTDAWEKVHLCLFSLSRTLYTNKSILNAFRKICNNIKYQSFFIKTKLAPLHSNFLGFRSFQLATHWLKLESLKKQNIELCCPTKAK